MYYHTKVRLADDSTLSRLDNPDLEDVRRHVLAYLLGENFELSGSILKSDQIRQLIITKSENTSSECVPLAYSRMPIGKDISPEMCVFDNARFAEDITETLKAELQNHPSLVKRQTAVEIWKADGSSQFPLDLKSTVTSLYVTAKHLAHGEADRRYSKFRLKVMAVLFLQYALFVWALTEFDFKSVIYPIIVIAELSLHVVGVLLCLYDKEYHPRQLIKAKKEKLLREVYAEQDFNELDIRNKIGR